MSDRLIRVSCGVLCSGLSVACLWFALQQWQLGQAWKLNRSSFIGLLCSFAALFAFTAVSVVFQWRIGRVFALVSGWLLVLYAVAVVLMGWEDVGGARGAIALFIASGGSGAITLLAARKARGVPGEAA